ncbi:hypothetical protein ACQ86N_46695 [Puia sp. P3]|uniref:hypothetical protein n=1 Tax=Puia sp. P3 TaxID=3423952 RepID=UPI003D67B69D
MTGSTPDRDRIYRVGARIREDHGNGTIAEGYGREIPAPTPAAIHAEIPSVETIAPFYPYRADVSIPSANRKIAAPNTGGAISRNARLFWSFDPCLARGQPGAVHVPAI